MRHCFAFFSCALLETSCCCLYHLSADDETSNVLKRSVKNVHSRFGSRLYIKITQTFQSLCSGTDRVAMGSPIAPLLADVCMNWILDQASSLLDQNTALIRYVDDILCVTFNQTVFDKIFRILSGIHSSIQFSQEIKEHHQLSFLDLLSTRNGNTLQTSV